MTQKGIYIYIYSAQGIGARNNWIVFLTYVTISYVLSLRGNKGLILDLNGLNKD